MIWAVETDGGDLGPIARVVIEQLLIRANDLEYTIRAATEEGTAPSRIYPAGSDPAALRVDISPTGILTPPDVAIVATIRNPARRTANARCGSPCRGCKPRRSSGGCKAFWPRSESPMREPVLDDCGLRRRLSTILTLETGVVKRRIFYCADRAALIPDYRAGVAFDAARRESSTSAPGRGADE
jgi:hypothetical protein